MTDCIVKWSGGEAFIGEAELGDPRVAELLDRLARGGVKNPSIEFVDDDFLDLACKAFVVDPKSRYCLECGYPRGEHRATVSAEGSQK